MWTKRSGLLVLVAGLVLGGLVGLQGSTAAVAQGGPIEIAVVWSGAELEAFQKVIDNFVQKTGIQVTVNSVGRDLPQVLVSRVAAGNPPDLSALPNPGQMREFAQQGALVPLSFDIVADHPKAFVDLGTVDGQLYGVFLSADLKSLIWYNPKVLGPGLNLSSWDALVYFTQGAADAGISAWCIGLESGAASGWPGTDWIEDIMLRTAGPEVYDQWVNHDIPWTDARVKRAFELFGQIVRNPNYVLGGPQGALSTNFGESPNGLFTDPPGCLLHRQATFIQSFILEANPDLVPGEDFDIFLFPPIDLEQGNPLLGAGDLLSVFKDSPAARELIAYLASAEAQEIWVGQLKKLPINTRVDVTVLENPIAERAARLLFTAEAFRFDGSDLMPAAVGSGEFWRAVLDYVGGADVCDVLRRLEQAADQAYTSGAATNDVVEPGACP